MIYFKEVQRFNQWWLWLLLLLVCIAPFYSLYTEIKRNGLLHIVLHDTLQFTTPIILFSVLILFFFVRLKTTIYSDHIQLKYSLFVNLKIPIDRIKRVRIIDYGFVGGWGIRFFTKHGTVYNVKGTKGAAILLKSGKQLVIGTQNVKGLSEALMKLNLLN